MSIPSREERSKYASQPSSPRMNPQPSFSFSRVTEPRISAPLLTIAERQSRFNRSPGAFLLVAIDVPDHSLHVSNSCSLRNIQPAFPFARSEADPSTFAQPARRTHLASGLSSSPDDSQSYMTPVP